MTINYITTLKLFDDVTIFINFMLLIKVMHFSFQVLPVIGWYIPLAFTREINLIERERREERKLDTYWTLRP